MGIPQLPVACDTYYVQVDYFLYHGSLYYFEEHEHHNCAEAIVHNYYNWQHSRINLKICTDAGTHDVP